MDWVLKYLKKECHPDGLLYGSNTTNTNKRKVCFLMSQISYSNTERSICLGINTRDAIFSHKNELNGLIRLHECDN